MRRYKKESVKHCHKEASVCRSHTHWLQIDCCAVGAVTTTAAGGKPNFLFWTPTLYQANFNLQGHLRLSHTCKKLVLQKELFSHHFHFL